MPRRKPQELADDAPPPEQAGVGLPRLTNGGLRRLRLITGIVLVLITVLMILADMTAGMLGPIRPDYHVEPLVFGTVLGALLLNIGIELGSRWPWGGGGGGGE